MQIIINDVMQDVTDGTAAAAVVEAACGGRPQGIAVAINDEVLPRGAWDDYRLQANDRVLIVQAVQGG